MKITTKQFQKYHRKLRTAAMTKVRILTGRLSPYCIVPETVCADGTSISIQASEAHYCEPRETGCRTYKSFEVWDSSSGEPLGWISAKKVVKIINKHGGLKGE
jgi:hypothetical protein